MILFCFISSTATSKMIPPHYLDCTVAIGKVEDGKKHWIGTGFLVGKYIESLKSGKTSYQLFLVTNKHVLAGSSAVILKFNSRNDQPSKDYDVALTTNGVALWTGHPDKEVDIAVYPLATDFLTKDNMNFSFFAEDTDFLSVKKLIEEDISEGDLIYILGFPLGIVDEMRKFVIVKAGIIAKMQNLSDKDKRSFLIDAMIFPGNSGSPIVYKPQAASIAGTKNYNKAGLIGIVNSYIPYQDIAYSLHTNRPRIIFEENSGLAVVFTVDMILEAIEKCYMEHKLTMPKLFVQTRRGTAKGRSESAG
jgi:S1-C subfamily serine protease